MPISNSLAETEKLAQDFVRGLKPLANQAAIVGLYGDLGSGKTAFVQAAARALGIKREVVPSPTFVLIRSYKLPRTAAFGQLVHLDCYRLDAADEMVKLNWSALVADPVNLILVEWAEKIARFLPAAARAVYFKFVDESTREISFI